MKRYIAFFSSSTAFNLQSCNLLNSYDDIDSAMSEMENIHRNKYPNDLKWKEEYGFIFDLKENEYFKKEDSIWREYGKIPDAYHEIIKLT